MNKHDKKTVGDTVLPNALTEALLESVSPLTPESQRAQQLRANVLAQIKMPQPSAPNFLTIRATEGHWQNLGPLVEKKLLHEDSFGQSFLLRLHPGATLPAHMHSADEECLILEGEGFIGDIYLRAGDFHLAPAGLSHGKAYSATGALLYIRTHAKDYRAGL